MGLLFGGTGSVRMQTRTVLWTIAKVLLVWLTVSWFLPRRKEPVQADPPVSPSNPEPLAENDSTVEQHEQRVVECTFDRGDHLDLRVYINNRSHLERLDEPPDWEEFSIEFGETAAHARTRNISFEKTGKLAGMWNDQDIYAHLVFTRKKDRYHKYQPSVQSGLNNFYVAHTLTKRSTIPRVAPLKNLVSGEPVSVEAHFARQGDGLVPPAEAVLQWTPSLSVSLVDDSSVYDLDTLPNSIRKYLRLSPNGKYYHPIVYVHEFWLTSDRLISVNETTEAVPLSMTYKTMPMLEWQIYVQMEESFAVHTAVGTMTSETVKEVRVRVQ